MADAIPHATPLLPPGHQKVLPYRRRVAPAWPKTTALTLDEFLRRSPVSARWRRVLLERLDALAVIYRLARSPIAAMQGVPHWLPLVPGPAPVDAGIVLPGGRTVAVVRQGLTADRTGFAKRLWRLREGPPPGGLLLVLTPDEVRLRQSRRMLAGPRPSPCSSHWNGTRFLAGLDSSGVASPFRQPSELDLGATFCPTSDRGGGLPEEAPESQARAILPAGH